MIQRFGHLLGSSSNAAPISVAGNSLPLPAYDLDTGLITVVATDLTPAAKDFTAVAATDILTAANHGLQLGTVLQVSNSGGGLPGGLSASTDYFAIPINGDTFYLATSYANAVAGTKINITTAGTGTQTETPTALAGGTATLQSAQSTQAGAVRANTWANVPNSAQTISGLGAFNFSLLNIDAPFYRIAITGNTAGVLGIECTFSVKTVD